MSERGSAVVEFALVLPLALLVLLALGEVVATGRAQLEVISAAREGARVAAVSPDPAKAADSVRAVLPPRLAAVARVSVTRPHVVGEPAEVGVTAVRTVAAPLFGGFPVELRATASMRVEQ